jgi:hypothetical protein
VNPAYGRDARDDYNWDPVSSSSYHAVKAVIRKAAREAQKAGNRAGCAMSVASRAESGEQVALVHDIFGNPFRVHLSLEAALFAWGNGIIANLARAAYDDRNLPAGTLDNARLVVLADALEEAGGDDPELLGHLRRQGQGHVRGCWALDLVLGKG